MSGRGQTWTQDEVRCLLNIWAEQNMCRLLEKMHKNTEVFKIFRDKMKENGFQRTVEQCRVKVKKLRQHYFKIREALRKSGSSREKDKFLWYDDLDRILNMRPTVRPVDVGESYEEDKNPATAAAVCTSSSSSAGTENSVKNGRRKRHREADHLTVLRKMQVADELQQERSRAEQELNRAQRERHLQMTLDDAVRARELEAVVRRQGNAETAAFNQAFLGTLSQLVQASTSPPPAPGPAAAPTTPAPSSANVTPQRVFTGRRKRHQDQDHMSLLREMQAADEDQKEMSRTQQELNRAQRERHLQMTLEDAARARELEAALRREENAQAAAFNQAFLGTLSQLVQALSSRRDPVPPPLD